MAPLFIFGFTLLCFCPMFMKHGRRRKRLRAMTLNGGASEAQTAFDLWRSSLISNAKFADLAAICFASMWLSPLAGSTYVSAASALLLFFAAGILPLQAIRRRKRAMQAKDGSFDAISIKDLDRK